MAKRIDRHWTASFSRQAKVDQDKLHARCPHTVVLPHGMNDPDCDDAEFWLLEDDQKGSYFVRQVWLDSIHQPGEGALTNDAECYRRFHFSDADTAFHFRMRWS